MKVFISQPMKDLTNEQIKSNRDKVVKDLTTQGYEIIDSVFDYEDVEGLKNKPLFYLSKSLELMAKEADIVCFMRDWSEAKGCVLEYSCAVAYNIPILYEPC